MGIAGRVAQSFLRSKLTPLVTIASLAVGLLGIAATPREDYTRQLLAASTGYNPEAVALEETA